MEKLEYEGKIYFNRDGKWYDSQTYCEATVTLQSILNDIYNSQIDFDKMDYKEIIKLADGYKKSKSYIMAIKAYEKAIEKTNKISEIKYILPRITSCYRKNNQSKDAIELYKNIYEEYNSDVLDDALLTSIAAAYIDIEEYDNAKKCADRAYAMSNGKVSDELKMYIQD